jgi:hypothetical protein
LIALWVGAATQTVSRTNALSVNPLEQLAEQEGFPHPRATFQEEARTFWSLQEFFDGGKRGFLIVRQHGGTLNLTGLGARD